MPSLSLSIPVTILSPMVDYILISIKNENADALLGDAFKHPDTMS
jgi:hypothetical protein